jgi:hypothetical protein
MRARTRARKTGIVRAGRRGKSALIEGAARCIYGVRQLAAALGPMDRLHRSDDESGSKLPQSKIYDFPP